jgi:CRISPR-associated protein Cas1
VYEDNKNTLLRHQQHVRYQDAQFQKTIAQDIVRGKLHNEYLFLQRIARKLPDDQKLEQELVNLERVRKKLEEVADVDEIRGYEGQGARIYFRVFGLNLLPEWALFHTRSKNPPLDPVNSVLSFLYTMLANRIDTYIFLEGLDASIGNLHALSYGRKSLVFDLMEEFRTPIVDTLVCSLFNMGTLKPHDFHTEDVLDGTEEELVGDDVKQRAVLLTEEGMRKVLIQFEKKLSTEHTYPIQNKIISYDGILHGQVNQYKQVVTGQRDHYLPLVVT